MKIVDHSVIPLHATSEPEKVIEAAGRLCWKSEERITPESHTAFIRMLKAKGHESVLEHASAGFIITTDRGISHELVRHRLASYSQTSTRFCNYAQGRFGSGITVVKPLDIQEGTSAYGEWLIACLGTERSYRALIERGCRPQEARSVLNNSLATQVAMTANLREWRLFLRQRLAPAAHPDMRVVAGLIRDELVKIAPTVFEEWAAAPQTTTEKHP